MKPTQKPATTPVVEPTPADILRGAALYLDRYGWIQGRYYNLTYQGAIEPTPAACAGGAVALAAYGQPVIDPEGAYTLPEHADFQRAWNYFNDYLTMTGALPADVEPVNDWDDVHNISGYGWNDQPGRTVNDVIAALHAAADDWDRTHGGAR